MSLRQESMNGMKEHLEEQSVIKLLDSLTVDKIAAGEVIEGPASCIKELIDNAIDAAATHIIVEISVGGREKIKVTDNGIGMSAKDLLMSIERHATSKISSIDDLERLHSRGFRGEALSSIASVSKMTLTSCKRREDDSLPLGERGAQLIIHGGIQQSFQYPIAAPFGTSILIEHLFYNVPARRKFMKSPQKDGQEIMKTMSQLALAAPHIGFQLIHDGVQKLNFPVQSDQDTTKLFEERVRAILGDDVISQGMFFFEKLSSTCSMQGFLGFPEAARSTRSLQHIIVNGRPIQSMSISYAIKAGYATSIGRDQHPVFVFQMDIPSEDVDVNVHPQKKEMRFKDEEKLKDSIIHVVAKHLFKLSHPSDLGLNHENHREFLPLNDRPFEDGRASHWTDHVDRGKLADSELTDLERFETNWIEQSEKKSSFPSYFNQRNEWSNALFSEHVAEYVDGPPKQVLEYTPSYRWHKVSSSSLYVFVIYTSKTSSHERSMVIHLPTAFKAALITQALKSVERRKSIIHAESLLVPHLLRLSKDQYLAVEGMLPEIEAMGFSVRPFGANTFLIEAVPQGTDLATLDLDTFFSLITSQTREGESEEVAFGSEMTPEMRKAIRRASSLMSSLMPFTKGSSGIPDKLSEYIVKMWIEMDSPVCSVSGERIAVSIDDSVIGRLFTTAQKNM